MKKQFTMFLCGCFLLGSISVASAQTIYTVGHGTQPAALVVSTSADVTICLGNTTNLTGNETGGTGPFAYAWSPSDSLSSTNTSSTTANPSANTTYNLTITDSRNCTASDAVTVTVVDCSGLDEIKEIETISLYPNPSHGDFNLSVQFKTKPTNVMVQIFNMNGQLIMTKNYEKPGFVLYESYSLSNASAGNYLLRITVGNSSLTKSIIIK